MLVYMLLVCFSYGTFIELKGTNIPIYFSYNTRECITPVCSKTEFCRINHTISKDSNFIFICENQNSSISFSLYENFDDLLQISCGISYLRLYKFNNITSVTTYEPTPCKKFWNTNIEIRISLGFEEI